MAYRMSAMLESVGAATPNRVDGAIQSALEAGRIQLAAQPVAPVLRGVEPSTWVELLIRPFHEGVSLPANAVIDRAAETGFARLLDMLVLASGLEWLARTPDVELCSINVSGHSVSNPAFLGDVLGVLERTRVEPARLCLEVTETVPIQNFASAREFASRLRRAGCHMALDDFGTGASNMLMLAPMEMDYLKIDGRFIRHTPGREDYTKLVRGIVAFAETVGLRTVAECVETREQYECARDMGVDFIQGYYREGEPRLVESPWVAPLWERHGTPGRVRSTGNGVGTTGD